MRAGCASIRKSNASCPVRVACKIAQHSAERHALLQLGVHLAQDRQVAEPKERVGVVLERPPDEAPFLKVAKMILAKRRIHREDVALAVVLLAKLGHGRQPDEATEIVFADDPDAAGLLGVDLGGAAELLAMRALIGARAD